ncbi:MAG: GNAT family protein [Streptococcus sp.]|nr:GNAT family protein [Streptococcus sp.]
MSNVYEYYPKFESDKFLLRFVDKGDVEQLLAVYSDKNSLPFFNSDNCHGDNFYYPTRDKMEQAVNFWLESYKTKWFVRWVIVDKSLSKAIGTIELFKRIAEDKFDGVGVLRLDLKSEYEKSDIIEAILKLIIPPAYELFDCEEIITKVPNYAIERLLAVSNFGFKKSNNLLVGTYDGYSYKDYWVIHK